MDILKNTSLCGEKKTSLSSLDIGIHFTLKCVNTGAVILQQACKHFIHCAFPCDKGRNTLRKLGHSLCLLLPWSLRGYQEFKIHHVSNEHNLTIEEGMCGYKGPRTVGLLWVVNKAEVEAAGLWVVIIVIPHRRLQHNFVFVEYWSAEFLMTWGTRKGSYVIWRLSRQ